MRNRFGLLNLQQDPFGFIFNPQIWERTPDSLRRIGNMRIELSETENEYVVDVEIPGVDKKDITLDVDGGILSVAVETKRDKETELSNKVLHTERYYGMMKRSVSLPEGIDDSAIKASYSNGILHVVLPKKTESEPESKQINID